MTKIEQVARAIEATMFAPHELPVSDALHRKYCETARAAIAAMREPTEAMMVNSFHEGMWREWIDAALGEK